MAKSELSLNELTQALADLGQPVSFAPVIKQIRQVLIGGTKTHFDAEETPDGRRWPPLKNPRSRKRDRSKKRRGRRDKVLNDTGLLRSSVTASQGQGHFEEQTDHSLEWGTNLIYAATHQYGDPRRHIPAREFLGISRDMEEDIEDLVGDFVEEEIARRIG